MERIAFALILVLLASGCICGGDNNTAGNEATTTIKGTEPSVTTTLKASTGGGGVMNTLNDIASAISSGQAYRCVYTYQNVQSEMFVKGQKFSSTANVGGQITHSISDGAWMYIWQEGQNTGTKFNIAEMKANTQKTESGYTDINTIADTASNVECSLTATSDSRFTPPSNIQFQDMGELLKQLQNGQG